MIPGSTTGSQEAHNRTNTPTPTVLTPPSTEASHRNSPRNPRSGRSSPLRSKERRSPTPPPLPHPTQFDVKGNGWEAGEGSDIDEDNDFDMAGRPPLHRPTDGRSQTPLLKDERGRPSYDSPNGSARPAFAARRSTFRSRSPEFEGASATRKKYTFAAFFLVLSLITFTIQTETAVYIQHGLKWKKPYCML